ncbi:Protein phosphatase 2C (PP2C)-like domain containing protein, partial [Elaphomyces granulatus]
QLDRSSTGLKVHLKRAEETVLSNSVPTLIKTVEDLYYVLYARLVIEMSNVQLCSSFDLDIRCTNGMDRFFLPEPKHLYAIFCSCKDVLDSPQVCKELDKEIIRQHQERFIRKAIRKSTGTNASSNASDSTGYRRYIMQLTSDPNSPFCQKWRGLNPVFQMAPGEILAVLSEKYLSVTPRERRISNALKHFPFLDWESVDSGIWERKAIEAHRQATLAMLEGKSVGDKRREDYNRPLIEYVRERKCVCYGFCACAKRCTQNAERLCPCAERTMSIFLSLDPEELPFGSRCTILAEIIFDGFSKVPREDANTEIAEEVQFALDIFEREIKDHRRAVRRVRFWYQDRRPSVKGEPIRGLTNGDDAILASEDFIGVNDGVGEWATRPQGHPALWSRLILHFWALEVERRVECSPEPDVVQFLQRAYEETIRATNNWMGTTTSATALLHHISYEGGPRPLLYVTNLGDSRILVIRPSQKRVLFKTTEQWHWFDCPMQLGSNSVDQPRLHAVLSKVELEENDIVVAVSDGVTDNLWEQELLTIVLESIEKWEVSEGDKTHEERTGGASGGMIFAARRLLNAALNVARDPSAESPYMERAIDEGLPIEGGKMDDVSIVLALCKTRNT